MITNGYQVNVEYVTNLVVDHQTNYSSHREHIQDQYLISHYRHGNCYFFGLALHYELDYQIVGIMGRWKKAGHIMAEAPNGLLYDIGGGYNRKDWEGHYGDWDQTWEKPIMNISEKQLLKQLGGADSDPYYSFKSYDQTAIENAIGIIRAYPHIYKPYPRNIVIGRHY